MSKFSQTDKTLYAKVQSLGAALEAAGIPRSSDTDPEAWAEAVAGGLVAKGVTPKRVQQMISSLCSQFRWFPKPVEVINAIARAEEREEAPVCNICGGNLPEDLSWKHPWWLGDFGKDGFGQPVSEADRHKRAAFHLAHQIRSRFERRGLALAKAVPQIAAMAHERPPAIVGFLAAQATPWREVQAILDGWLLEDGREAWRKPERALAPDPFADLAAAKALPGEQGVLDAVWEEAS